MKKPLLLVALLAISNVTLAEPTSNNSFGSLYDSMYNPKYSKESMQLERERQLYEIQRMQYERERMAQQQRIEDCRWVYMKMQNVYATINQLPPQEKGQINRYNNLLNQYKNWYIQNCQ